MNKSYLVINNNVVTGTRVIGLELTEEEYNALSEKGKTEVIEQAAWEYADVYPEETDDCVYIVVSLGLVGCDTHVDTDIDTLEDWENLDVSEQNMIIREAFWEAVDCHVVFEPSDERAEYHTNWGYKG